MADSTVATPHQPAKRTIWRIVEWTAWAMGLCLFVIWGTFYFTRTVDARRSVARFVEAKQSSASLPADPDVSLWSPRRIKAWQDSLLRPAPTALAVLRIPRIKLEVPVLEGTDDWTLDRAVGHIEDTAAPGVSGNVGIAGHRDGFFRGLKDVVVGDALELATPHATERYQIERIWIVQPEEVSVLNPTESPTITLVTCYPFYFIGSAPQRYIVRANRISTTKG